MSFVLKLCGMLFALQKDVISARRLSWYFIQITIFKIRLLEVSSTTSNQAIKIVLITIIFIDFL